MLIPQCEAKCHAAVVTHTPRMAPKPETQTGAHIHTYLHSCFVHEVSVAVLLLRLRPLLMPATKHQLTHQQCVSGCCTDASSGSADKRPASRIIYAPTNISDRLCNKNSKRQVNKINCCNMQPGIKKYIFIFVCICFYIYMCMCGG